VTVVEGVVEHGDERGRTLGFPTANIQLFDAQTFSNIHALTEQLHHDITATRNWAQRHYPWLVPPGSHH
jgi:FAD synthase